MDLISALFALFAGVFTTIQTTIDARLAKYVTPSIATLHSLATGMVFILIISLVKGNMGRYARVMHINPILLIGGIFGAFIIYFSAKAIQVIGVSKTLILIVAGQLLSSFFLDVFLYDADVNFKKIIGIVLFLIGALVFIKE